jgi:O-antigen/teichoic acid export membrane protein
LRTSPETSSSAPQSGAPDRQSGALDPDHEARVGRGAALLTAAKLWFIVSGYAIEFALPRVFAAHAGKAEGKELYGAYGLVTGLAAILNAFVYQGTSQAVARFVGRAPEDLSAVRRAAFRLQTWLVGGLFAVLLALAPWIADAFYGRPDLAAPIRYAGFVLLSFGFYAVTMGSLTGRELFKRQALIDVGYSTLKVVCIVGCAVLLGKALGWVESAVFGFALASAATLALSLALAPREPLRGRLSVGELLRFQAFTMVFNLLVTLVARFDLQLLQAFRRDAGESGDYKAAQAIATIPYQAVFAITFVLFPLVSGAAARDPARVRSYTREATRYALIIASLVALCWAGAPRAAVTLLYPPEYASAGAPLRVLVLGYLAFSVFYVMTAVLTAGGRPQASLVLVAIVVALQAGLGAILIPAHGAVGIAAATAIAMAAGLVGAQIALVRGVGGGLAPARAARILLPAAAVAFAIHLLLDQATVIGRPGLLASAGGSIMGQRLVTVVVFGVASVVFTGLLFLTGGLGREDVERFRRVFARSPLAPRP